MNEKQKILVCGDVEGKFKSFFGKVENTNKKFGPFDMVLCVGNFFGVNNIEFDDYKSCRKQVSIPTYILGPNKQEHEDLYPEGLTEFCPNVHYLGKRGIYYSSGGLKIAYLSGVPNTDSKSNAKSFEFNKSDVVAMRDSCKKGQANFRGVDLLLTSPWPQNIINLDSNAKAPKNVLGSELISWLAMELRPRYHFVGIEGLYYERPPYRNLGSQGEAKGETATRFIGLARAANDKHEKWIYALSLTPIERMKLTDLYQQTTDETPCPYDGELLARAPGNIQFFYNLDAPVEKRKRDNRKDHPRKKPEFDQSKCWFCLASPEVEKHLVISVGDEIYLALAKGGMIEEHLLILPVEHHQSTLSLSESALGEIEKFKKALIKYFKKSDQVPIFFERNYKTSHLQIQVVPVPENALKELADIFKEEAEGNGFKLNELPEHIRLNQVIPSGSPYFWAELPDVVLYTRCKSGFPLQFGREVLATDPVLNIPDRVEWKDCVLSRIQEEELVQRIRKSFEPFDFTV